MKPLSRNLFLVAVLSLGLMYVFPLWQIKLSAPQYPEGIGMYIWVNKITGKNPHDLRNINNLNHYIGMKEIVPESIPELRIMPYLVGVLMALGLIVWWRNRRSGVAIWLALLVLLLIAGLVDFYLWEYDYGHNLDPHAAIKIPGMSYQPPLIGSKQLLNMRTTSLPHAGALAAALAVVLASASLLHTRHNQPQPKALKANVEAAVVALLMFAACTPQAEPIRFGSDECSYCRMRIADTRYGAELVTTRGKVFKFDSAECMAAYLLKEMPGSDKIYSLWVIHFVEEEQLIDGRQAWFLQSENLRSPMGLNLTAFAQQTVAAEAAERHGGELLRWAEVERLVNAKWLEQ